MTTNFKETHERKSPRADGEQLGPYPGVLVGGPAARAKKREYLTLSITKNLGSIAAVIWMVKYGSGWVEWSGFLFFYVISMMGVVIGYHRYFSHRCFETSKPMRYFIGILAQLASQASVLKWAADHRRHHARAERIGDTHSPYLDSYGKPMGRIKGLANSQVGWLLDDTHTDYSVYGKGLVDDEVVNFCIRTRWFWYFASVVLLPGSWALAFGGPEFVLGTILIAGFLRINVVLHAVLAVNSFGHTYGKERYKNNHKAKNNWIIAILTLGDGWHNNHHQHPRSAVAGMAWYEIDICGLVVRLWEKMGLVWNVHYPPKLVRDEAGNWVEEKRAAGPGANI